MWNLTKAHSRILLRNHTPQVSLSPVFKQYPRKTISASHVYPGKFLSTLMRKGIQIHQMAQLRNAHLIDENNNYLGFDVQTLSQKVSLSRLTNMSHYCSQLFLLIMK